MIVTLVCRVDDNSETLEKLSVGLNAALHHGEALGTPPFVWALPNDGTVQMSTWAKLLAIMGEEKFVLMVPEVAGDVIDGNYDGAPGGGTMTTGDVPSGDGR